MEWSDEVARTHGYEPGRGRVDHALLSGGSFSSRHRFIDTGGRVHTVIVT